MPSGIFLTAPCSTAAVGLTRLIQVLLPPVVWNLRIRNTVMHSITLKGGLVAADITPTVPMAAVLILATVVKPLYAQTVAVKCAAETLFPVLVAVNYEADS